MLNAAILLMALFPNFVNSNISEYSILKREVRELRIIIEKREAHKECLVITLDKELRNSKKGINKE